MKNPHSRFRYGKTCVRATTAGSEKGGGLSNILRSALKKRSFFKIVPVGLLKLGLALSRHPRQKIGTSGPRTGPQQRLGDSRLRLPGRRAGEDHRGGLDQSARTEVAELFRV